MALRDNNGLIANIGGSGGSGGVINAPLGTIISYMGNTPPEEYLACDGAIYNISTYQELADFINREFGSYNYFGGDGTSTFAVPDLRGEFLRGTGTNPHSNQGNGADVGEHQDGTQLPAVWDYQGRINIAYKTGSENSPVSPDKRIGDTSTFNGQGYPSTSKTDTSSIGYFQYTTRPTNTSVLYCIKYKTTETGEIYSEEERVVGKWIDGKPVYRKVLKLLITNTDGSTVNTVPHNIVNLDTVVNENAICKLDNDFRMTNQLWASGYFMGVMINSTHCNIVTNYARTLNKQAIITIEYTKTTD